MVSGNRVQMRRPTISRSTMVVLPVVLVVVAMAGLAVLGASVDTALGVAGLVFGLATLALSQLRERDTPRKRVLFVGQEDDVFNTNILQGLRAEADARRLPYELDVRTPDDATDATVDWQLAALDDVNGHAALVLLPSGDDFRLWRRLVQLTAQGVTVVVLDVEPPWELFADQHLRAPVFVASDFVAGGRMAGQLMAEKLAAEPDCRAVVCLGPDFSRPGVGRSSHLLYTVARLGFIDRVHTVDLQSWDAAAAGRTVSALVGQGLSRGDARVVVFCGDDRILMAVSDEGSRRPEWTDRVQLVGYDGLLDAGGRYVIARYALSVGTVDTQPDRQGRAAARALVHAYSGVREDRRTQLVEPRLVTAPRWK